MINKVKTVLDQKLAHSLLPLWAGAFMDVLGISVLNPYLAPIFLDLGVPVALIGMFLSINVFMGFFSGIFWGSLSDRFGRRPILIICRVGALAGYLLLAFSTNLTMIVISRIIDGIFSKNVQIVLTIVGDRTSPDQRTNEMSKAGLAWLLGGLIGPGIGALLFQFGILGIGLFNSLLAAIALVITVITLKESHPTLVANLPVSKDFPREKKPFVSISLLKERLPRLRLSQSLFNALSLFIFRLTLSLFVTVRFGFSFAQIGILLTATGMVSLFVRLLIFPRVLRKLGDYLTLMLGFVIFSSGFVWLIFLNSIWEFAIVIIMIGFGTYCSIDIMHGIISKEVKKEQIGEMIGLVSAVESIALITGPIIGSYLISLPNPALFGLVSTLISLFPILIGVIFDKRFSFITWADHVRND